MSDASQTLEGDAYHSTVDSPDTAQERMFNAVQLVEKAIDRHDEMQFEDYECLVSDLRAELKEEALGPEWEVGVHAENDPDDWDYYSVNAWTALAARSEATKKAREAGDYARGTPYQVNGPWFGESL